MHIVKVNVSLYNIFSCLRNVIVFHRLTLSIYEAAMINKIILCQSKQMVREAIYQMLENCNFVTINTVNHFS